jgi:hypothetical protein
LSINQISKKLKKSYPYINSKVNELIEQGIFNKIQVARSYLCSINLKNDQAIVLLTLNEIKKKNKFLIKKKNFEIEKITKIKNKFKIYTIFFSDNKLCFVLDYINDKDAILNQFPFIKKYNPRFFDKISFQENILSEKSILENHIILYAFEKYFELIEEIEEKLFIKYSPLYSQIKST